MSTDVATRPDHVTHGLRLPQAALPRGCKWLQRKLGSFRRALEAACCEVHGEVRKTDRGYIAAAIRWERHAQLRYRWLRVADDQLSLVEKAEFDEAAARATDRCNAAIAKLGLDQAQENIINVLYRRAGFSGDGNEVTP